MIDPKYATFRPRLATAFMDWLICIPFFSLCSMAESGFESVTSQLIFYLVTSSAWLVYSVGMHAQCGQTLGKKFARVIVLDVSERPLSLRQALWRDSIGLVTWFLSLAVDIPRILQGVDLSNRDNLTRFDHVLMGAGLFWLVTEFVTMFTNDKRRAVHDFMAGSVVVRLPASVPQPEVSAAIG